MVYPTAVIDTVALNESLIGAHTPNLQRLVARGRLVKLRPPLPAVTTTAQASMLTGTLPHDHGVVGNGWYHRDLAEVRFWHRSARLVEGEKVWDTAKQRDPSMTCANLFWWYNTYSTCDQVVQVRPMYKADGRKLPDCYAEPDELRHELQRQLGTFPLFHLWGPASDIRSTRWVVDAALHVHEKYEPTLMLVYLPHLDYPLQKLGPAHPDVAGYVAQLDTEVGRLLARFDAAGVRTVVVNEYGIEPVSGAVAINRALREAELLRVREEDGCELLDAGASRAFAVADHQVAHVYVQRGADVERVRAVCEEVSGVERVLDREAQRAVGLDHERAGELVLVAEAGWWFTYDYWLDDAKAPDFARTVDIHRKPGYDPRELFIDSRLRWPKAAIAWRLLKKKLGFRTLMDVITLDASLVRGSHGRVDLPGERLPVMIVPGEGEAVEEVSSCAVRDVVLSALFEERVRVAETRQSRVASCEGGGQ
ncbi:MAG: alkaline phosphatase family protein [Phycisphaeraceae bacterium]